jgi:O-antigen ligase
MSPSGVNHVSGPGRLRRFVDGVYVDRAAAGAAFARMHRQDRLGDRLHLMLACLGLFLVAGPVTVTELAFAPLLVFFVVRIKNTGPLWIHGFGQPAVLAALALAAWLGATLLWSPDRAQGLDEIVRLRWFLLVPLLYPVIERRSVLVMALASGLIAAGVAQLLSGFEGLRPPFPVRHPGRVTGWWDPVVAGSMQVGAIGLFLPAALVGVGRARWVGGVGLAVALAGLLASGTRGAWLAGGLLVVIGAVLVLRRAGRRDRLVAVGVLAGGLLAAGAVGLANRDGIAIRLDQARSELAAAAAGDLETSTGGRLGVMRVAAGAGLAQPWGVGAGGIRAAAAERYGPGHAAVLAHAHCTPLHLWGVGGVPAVALAGLLYWTIIRSGVRAGRAPGASPERGSLERGVPYAAAGLLLAGLFDAVHLNTHTGAMMGVLAALSPAWWPGAERLEQRAQ